MASKWPITLGVALLAVFMLALGSRVLKEVLVPLLAEIASSCLLAMTRFEAGGVGLGVSLRTVVKQSGVGAAAGLRLLRRTSSQ